MARGFAALSPEKRAEIARKGGRTAHQKGAAHTFSSEEARAAGAKGGKAAHARGGAHTFSPEEAREANRRARTAKADEGEE